MPKFKLTIKHTLDKDEAKKRLRQQLESILRKKIGEDIVILNFSWIGHTADMSFLAGAKTISFSLQVKRNSVLIDGKLPLSALPFRKRIKQDLLNIGNAILSS